ncbi:hypothetical protein CES85_4021 [Ochrobactrum quorumnocens]|uniref:Uncharacterized protein n=1 Tax=Ochrobactrum quorumnocens TaxID=271865 RepID=A0A248U9I5_9HYPH|nr:hypothetical protein CES85_4021 [[Ochrobactrum] quorumnocens]
MARLAGSRNYAAGNRIMVAAISLHRTTHLFHSRFTRKLPTRQ